MLKIIMQVNNRCSGGCRTGAGSAYPSRAPCSTLLLSHSLFYLEGSLNCLCTVSLIDLIHSYLEFGD